MKVIINFEECPFYTAEAKTSGFLPTNDHLTRQQKAKNKNDTELANPSPSVF
jgi:hypothetical protein